MSLLDFNDAAPKSGGSKRSLKYLFGIGALVGVIALGSTLAASINLNSGAPVEFGQGVAQTVACDSDGITLTPYSTFYNDEEASNFYFSSIKVSGVSSNCSGITFKLRAYMNGNNDPLYWPSSPNGDSFEFGFTASGEWSYVASCMAITNGITNSTDNNSATINWSGCIPEVSLAGEVDRITLETSDNPNSGVFPLEVGSVGPGGGIIFYIDSEGFACGTDLQSTCNYLEAAPKTWDSGTFDTAEVWCSNSNSAPGTLASIGSGALNTELMKSSCTGTTAANQVSDLTLGGESDWYIPSQDEAVEFYNNRSVFTGTYQLSGDDNNSDPARYLTSTESSGDPGSEFFYVKWFNGVAEPGWKLGPWSVRPIRAF